MSHFVSGTIKARRSKYPNHKSELVSYLNIDNSEILDMKLDTSYLVYRVTMSSCIVGLTNRIITLFNPYLPNFLYFCISNIENFYSIL